MKKNELERKYELFVDLPLAGFFQGLADYVGMIVEDKYLSGEINDLQKDYYKEEQKMINTKSTDDNFLDIVGDFNTVKRTHIWPMWQKIEEPYEIIYNSKKQEKDVEERGGYNALLEWYRFGSELKDILDNKNIIPQYFIKEEYISNLNNIHNFLITQLEMSVKYSEKTNTNTIKSIHLITKSVVVKDVIFVVLNEDFGYPFRFATQNNKLKETYIKKLHNIAYLAPDAPEKEVLYDQGLADMINNKLFKKRDVEKYMKTNKLNRNTIVQKSEDKKRLVLKNESLVKTILINKVPLQFQYLYLDKKK